MKNSDLIPQLFFNYPSKYWHFEDVLKESGKSRAQTNEWLKKLQKTNLIKRVKPQKKMPYYISKYEHPHYRNTKTLFALNQLHSSGLLNYLASQETASVIILFGSFASWDWHKSSDIDVFIYGDIEKLYLGTYSVKLKREIQVFHAKNIKDLKKLNSLLLQNIIKGITIKGSIPKELLKYAIV